MGNSHSFKKIVVVALPPLYAITLIQLNRCWIKEAKTPLLKTGELAESFGPAV